MTHDFGPNGRGGALAGSGSSRSSAELVERILAGCDASDGMCLDLDLELEGLFDDARTPAEIGFDGIFDEGDCAIGVAMGAASGDGMLDDSNGSNDNGSNSESSNNSNSNNKDIQNNNRRSNAMPINGNSFGPPSNRISVLGDSFDSLHSVPGSQPSIHRAQEGMLRSSFGSGSGSILSVPEPRGHQPDRINGVQGEGVQLGNAGDFDPSPAAAMGQNRLDCRPRRRATVDSGAAPTGLCRPQARAAPDPELSAAVGAGAWMGAGADSDPVSRVSVELDAGNPRPRPRRRATVNAGAAPTGLCRPQARAAPRGQRNVDPELSAAMGAGVGADSDLVSQISMELDSNPRPRPRRRATVGAGTAPVGLSCPQARAAPRGQHNADPELSAPVGIGTWMGAGADSDVVSQVSMELEWRVSMELDASNPRPRPRRRTTVDFGAAPTGLYRPQALATPQARAGFGPQGQVNLDPEFSMSDPGNLRPQHRQPQQPQRRVTVDSGAAPDLNQLLGGVGAGVDGQAQTLRQMQAGGNGNGMPYHAALRKLAASMRRTELSRRQLKMQERRMFGAPSPGPGPRPLRPPRAFGAPPSPRRRPRAFASLHSARRELQRRVGASGFAGDASAQMQQCALGRNDVL